MSMIGIGLKKKLLRYLHTKSNIHRYLSYDETQSEHAEHSRALGSLKCHAQAPHRQDIPSTTHHAPPEDLRSYSRMKEPYHT